MAPIHALQALAPAVGMDVGIRRGQPVADPSRTSGTMFDGVAPASAILTVRVSHRLTPTIVSSGVALLKPNRAA